MIHFACLPVHWAAVEPVEGGDGLGVAVGEGRSQAQGDKQNKYLWKIIYARFLELYSCRISATNILFVISRKMRGKIRFLLS